MHIHRGHESCIVHLAADNTVLHDQALPFRVDGGGIGEPRQDPLDFLDFGQRHCRSESKAVVCYGPRNNVPELRDVLQREIYWLAGAQDLGNALDSDSVVLMVGLSSAQQDVRIDEHTHLAAIAVNAFAADGLIR